MEIKKLFLYQDPDGKRLLKHKREQEAELATIYLPHRSQWILEKLGSLSFFFSGGTLGDLDESIFHFFYPTFAVYYMAGFNGEIKTIKEIHKAFSDPDKVGFNFNAGRKLTQIREFEEMLTDLSDYRIIHGRNLDVITKSILTVMEDMAISAYHAGIRNRIKGD